MNGQSTERAAVHDVIKMIQSSVDQVTLSVLKYCPTPQPSLLLSSSASSGHNLTESSPDATSISPRSPRWATSPVSQSTAKATPLKSSGSQTDSLDSPVARHQTGDKARLIDRAIKRIAKPFHSGERDERETRRKSSGYTFATTPSSYAPTEDDGIDGLNSIIEQYVKPHPSNAKPTKEKRARRTRQIEHGTWPKCRSHVDYVVGGMIIPPFNPKKPRPSLSAITQTNGGGFAVDSNVVHKLPPMPPERTDSFSRGASIKHSPQSSDSTIKYMHMTSGSSGANSSGSGSYTPSPSKASAKLLSQVDSYTPSPSKAPAKLSSQLDSYTPSPSKAPAKLLSQPDSYTPSPSKAPTILPSQFDGQPRTIDSTTSFENAVVSSHFPSRPATHESKTQPPDYTVRSAGNQELNKYATQQPEPASQKHRRSAWPPPASSHTQKERRGAPPLGSRSRPDYPAAKPMSLDIQPIYSPRPLPHSGQNITPSHPVAPPFVPPASHVSSAHQSSKPVHMSAENQSMSLVARPMATIASQPPLHTSSRDRMTAFTPHMTSNHGYPVG